MSKKIKVIHNPMADMGRARKIAAALRLQAAAHEGMDWSDTACPVHATELACKAGREGYPLVIAVGGDGTVHEVINGLMQVPARKRPALGIVPIGSGNDFAHALGIPGQPEEALKIALTGQTKSVDLGVIKDEFGRLEYVDNTLGIGFDTIVTIRSRKVPLFHGFAIYFIAVIQTILFNYYAPLMQIETDREKWQEQTLMLVLCNGPREGGGFLVAPEAKIDDGLGHYASIRGIPRLLMFRLIPEVMRGTHGRFPQVRMGTFRKMTLRSEAPLYIHADGEIYTGFDSKVRQFSFEIVPDAVKVVC